MLAFYVVLLTAVLVAGWFVAAREYRANHTWAETNCVVLATYLAESQGRGGTHYRPQVTIRYTAGGETRQATTYDLLGGSSNLKSVELAALNKFVVGQEYPCWVTVQTADKMDGAGCWLMWA